MSITIVQITDTHIHDQADALFKETQPDASLKKVITQAKTELDHIDGVVVSGDLTHDGTAASCQRLANLLADFNCPVYVTLGNHDAIEMIQKYLLNDQISMPDTVCFKHWQCLFADSHIEQQSHGFLSDDSLSRLDVQLLKNTTPALLFTHHPPVKINSLWMDKINMRNGPEVLQKLSAHKHLQAIAFGHIHQQWHSQHQHIDILGTPSSCVQFTAGRDDFSIDQHLPGYRVFHLHEDNTYQSQIIRLRA